VTSQTYELFTSTATLRLPERIALFGRVEGNLLKRLIAPAGLVEVRCTELPKSKGFKCSTSNGFTFAVVAQDTTSLHGSDAVLKVEDVSSLDAVEKSLAARHGKWLLPRVQKPDALTADELAAQTNEVRASWLDALELREERYQGDELVRAGFRLPQVGAVNATVAHWTVSSRPATLVRARHFTCRKSRHLWRLPSGPALQR